MHKANPMQIPARCNACTCWSCTGWDEACSMPTHIPLLGCSLCSSAFIGDELCMSHGLLTPSEPLSLLLFSFPPEKTAVFSMDPCPGVRQQHSCCSPCSLRCATFSATIHGPKVSHPRAPPAIIARIHGMSLFKQLQLLQLISFHALTEEISLITHLGV